MIEKVCKFHPDKIADRIGGAIVDYAYTLQPNPRVAVEVLVGHGHATIIAESSVILEPAVVYGIVARIAGIKTIAVTFIQAPQDAHLAGNQKAGFRCGDNGVFKARWNTDYDRATELAAEYGSIFISDGKYLFDFKTDSAVICQSNAPSDDVRSVVTEFDELTVNPLGYWTGGTDTDTGATNRKLGSDQPFCQPNGLHGKDLSKADVSVSIYVNYLSRQLQGSLVEAYCAIGDETVAILWDGEFVKELPFAEIVEFARKYIHDLGGFEKFAELGFRWVE